MAESHIYFGAGPDIGAVESGVSSTGGTTTGGVRPYKGIAYGYGFDWLTSANQDARIAKMVDLGVGIFRIDLTWSEIETSAGVYGARQAAWEAAALKVEAAGIKVLPVINQCPAWANGGTGGWKPPTNPADYANFCVHALGRIRSGGVAGLHVDCCEIWNEPNLASFWGGATPNAATYLGMLNAAYNAIKGQTWGAGITVVSAGLSSWSQYPDENASQVSALLYLQRLYTASGGALPCDALGYHMYNRTGPADANGFNAWYVINNSVAGAPSFRSLMVANGDTAKPIWCTEYGDDVPAWTTEADAGTRVTTTFGMWTGEPFPVGPYFYYRLWGDGDVDFALVSNAGVNTASRYPAYKALAEPAAPTDLGVVQSAAALAGPGTSLSFALPAAPTNGRVLVCAVHVGQFGATRAPTFPGGWTVALDTTQGFTRLVIATHPVAAGDGNTLTVAISGTADYHCGVLYELSGVNASAPVNAHAEGSSTGTATTVTTPAATPSALGCHVFGFLATDVGASDGPETITGLTAGWTQTPGAFGFYKTMLVASKNVLTADTTTPQAVTMTLAHTPADEVHATVVFNPPFITVPPSALIVDSNSDAWSITGGGQVAKNGVADATTSSVVELAYVNGSVWQKNSFGNWYQWLGSSWSAATTVDPTIPTPATFGRRALLGVGR